jgi:hypothetical protein
VYLNLAEFIMSQRDPAREAGFLDLLSQAVTGLFPLPVLEALIARLEDRR